MALYNVPSGLGATETTICQAGASETRALLSMIFCNTDTSVRTITVYAYPTGGSAGSMTTIINNLAIPAGDSYLWEAPNKLILAPLDKVSGIADVAGKISVLANYMEI